MTPFRTICARSALLATVLVSSSLLSAQTHPPAPRIAPLDEALWGADHRALVAKYVRDARPGNDVKTLLNYPEVVSGVLPFATYVANDSTLAARDRELLILRTAWLCGNEYVWAKHAASGRRSGLEERDLRRVAEGPDAAGWAAADATLLRVADELFRNSSVSDATWKVLSARYTTRQSMDAVFTVAEFTMLASMYNTLGVRPDAWLTDRLPASVPYRVAVPPREPPLTAARVPPIDPASMTPEIRSMLDPQGTGRPVIAIYRTIAQHPQLYPPRQILSEYIRLRSALTPRVREALILRIGWLCGSEYEWAQHLRAGRAAGLDTARIAAGPDARGWDAKDAMVLRAADELYRDARISDATWTALSGQFDARQLVDVLITTGGYRMVSMALNTLGVQLEPANERFPAR